ncbi:hypothetical protein [Actinoallomurus soli]|uniref:hypothetical protein n=1 Tax=Actinoallomurus soli TaxID=2952535 RepID=UPI00209329BF|nr:hypothetical protein [Actinoallomurus soli]MCO5973193.1 hypothetical protein [Actinoallomurus soli]
MKAMVVVAAALVAAGCSGRSEAGLDPTPAPPSASVPSGTALVLRTSTSGGIAGLGGPGSLPDFSLYRDGRVVAGASGALTEYRLTPRAVRRIVSAARDAGLATPRTVESPYMADAMYAVITFVVDGRPRTTRLVEPVSDGRAAALLALLNPSAWARGDLAAAPHPYRPAKVAALALPGSATGAPRWPFAVPLGSGTRVGTRTCTVLTGAEARKAPAGRWSDWTEHGRSYRVMLRPLLPDEADCSALA